jgi:hypothetical protein
MSVSRKRKFPYSGSPQRFEKLTEEHRLAVAIAVDAGAPPGWDVRCPTLSRKQRGAVQTALQSTRPDIKGNQAHYEWAWWLYNEPVESDCAGSPGAQQCPEVVTTTWRSLAEAPQQCGPCRVATQRLSRAAASATRLERELERRADAAASAEARQEAIQAQYYQEGPGSLEGPEYRAWYEELIESVDAMSSDIAMGLVETSDVADALQALQEILGSLRDPHRAFQLHQEARQADRDHDRIQRAESSVQAVVDDTVYKAAAELLNAAQRKLTVNK